MTEQQPCPPLPRNPAPQPDYGEARLWWDRTVMKNIGATAAAAAAAQAAAAQQGAVVGAASGAAAASAGESGVSGQARIAPRRPEEGGGVSAATV